MDTKNTVDATEKVVERLVGFDVPRWIISLGLLLLLFGGCTGIVMGPYFYGKHVGRAEYAKEEKDRQEKEQKATQEAITAGLHKDLDPLTTKLRGIENDLTKVRGIVSGLKPTTRAFDPSLCKDATKDVVEDANVGRR